MISITNDSTNSTQGLETFITSAEELGKQQKELENKKIQSQNSVSFGTKMDAALTDNLFGYISAKEGINSIFSSDINTDSTIQQTPITPEDKNSILKGAMVKPEDINDFDSVITTEQLYKDLGRYTNKKAAEDTLNSLPLSENLAFSMAASVVDPMSWAMGFGIGKVFKGVELATKFTGASALAFKALENGATVGGSVGVSEFLLQKENRVIEPERLRDTIAFSAGLGAGIALLPSAIVGSAGLASQATQSHGVQMALTPVNDFIRSHLVLNPMDQILNSKTMPQWGKDIINTVDVPVFNYKDVNGNIITRDSENAMGYKRSLEGQLYTAKREQIRQAKEQGIPLDELDKQHSVEYKQFETKIQDEVDRQYITKSTAELQTIYETETGVLLRSKKGKPVIPDDYYNVITNSFKRELESNTPVDLVVPKHLQYIHDFYKTFAEEGTKNKLAGLANKSSFGYSPRSYDIEAMNQDARTLVVSRFEEMLKANKLVQADLLTATPLKRTKIEEDIRSTAEYLVQKAKDTDLRARYLDQGSPNNGSTRSTMLRQMKLDTSLYPQYFSKSVVGDLVSYHDNMGGRLATKKFLGLQTDGAGTIVSKLKGLQEKAINEGASKADIKNLEALVETVLGTRKITNDPHSDMNLVSRLGRKFASAMYSAGFSMYSLGEVGSVIAKNGLVNTIKEFIPAHQHTLNMIKGLDKEDPMIKYFNDVGLAGMVLRDSKNNRFETGDLVHFMSKGEKVLDSVNQFGRKISFFDHVQDTLDFMAGGAFLNDIRTLSTKLSTGGALSPQELSKFSRYGITEQDIKKFNTQNIQYYPNSNVVKDYNFYSWRDTDLSKRMLQAMQNNVSETIVRTDGTRIHRWQSEVDGLKPLLLQYTQFPAAAYERLVLNMEEQTARTVSGAIAAMGISYAMLDLQDAALVQAGVKDVRTAPSDMAAKAFMKTQFSTILPNLWDMAAGLGGFTTSSGFTPNKGSLPSSPAITTANKVISKTVEIPKLIADGDYEKAFANVGSNAPILNALPFIKAGFKALTNQKEVERGSGQILGTPSKDFLMGRIEDTATHKLLKGN